MKKLIILCGLAIILTTTQAQKTEKKILLYKTHQIVEDGFVSHVETAEEMWVKEKRIIQVLGSTTYVCCQIDTSQEGLMKTIVFFYNDTTFKKGYVESDYKDENDWEIDYMEIYDNQGTKYIVVIEEENKQLIKILNNMLRNLAADCIDNGETIE